MICDNCKCKMLQGTAYFSSRSYDFDLLKPAPEIEFCVGDVTVESFNAKQREGWYCPECGIFTLSFYIKTHAVYEEGFDMDLDEELDALPQKTCPQCGESIDIDYPKCPECGFSFSE